MSGGKSNARLLLSSIALAILVTLAVRCLRDQPVKPPLLSRAPPARAAVPTRMAAPTFSPTQAVGKKALNSNTIEACGIGRFPDDDDGFADARKAVQSKLEHARYRWLASMLQSSDPRVRATGLLVEHRFMAPEEWLTKSAPASTVDSLVDLAIGSQDPVIYSMAVYTCRPIFGPAPGGSCEQISAKGWADMDQDNAAAWLAAAREARFAKDKTAENAAYSKAATAKRIDNYTGAFLAAADTLLPADPGPLEQYRLSYEFSGTASSLAMSFLNYLGPCATHDANPDWQSACQSMADLLLSKGTKLQELWAAAAIGEQLGWPEERLAALKQKVSALQSLAMDQSTRHDDANPWGCDIANRGNAFMRDWRQFGELGALERQLEQSEKTAPELAQDYQEYLSEVQRRADVLRKASAMVPQ